VRWWSTGNRAFRRSRAFSLGITKGKWRLGQKSELIDVTAKVVIYEAFVEGKLELPDTLSAPCLTFYFEPTYEDFRPRTIWSLSVRLQGTGPDSPIQGCGESGRIPGSTVLTIVLAYRAVSADRPFLQRASGGSRLPLNRLPRSSFERSRGRCRVLEASGIGDSRRAYNRSQAFLVRRMHFNLKVALRIFFSSTSKSTSIEIHSVRREKSGFLQTAVS
jgi:hypothetical protein